MSSKISSILFLTILLAFANLLSAQTVTIKDPIKYNDYMVHQQDLFGIELLNLIDLFEALPEDKSIADAQLQKVIEAAENGLAAQKNLKPLPNDFGLHKSVMDLFEFYVETMRRDYASIIDELYNEFPDLDKMDEIVLRVQDEEALLDEAFAKAQANFAKKHNFRLLENEMQEEFDQLNE